MISFHSIGFRPFGAPRSAGVDHRKFERGIALLLADGRQDHDASEFDFQRDLGDFALVVAHFDVMQALDAGFLHFVRNRMAAIAREPIDAGANQEMRAKVSRQAIELVNVTFSVADMDAALWLSKAFDRLPKIIEPAHAFLLFDRHSGRVDLPLERRRPSELLPGPEFHGRQAQRQPLGRHREAGMHQHPADRVMAQATTLVAAAIDALRHADGAHVRALVGELRRVLDQKNRTIGRIAAGTCGREMAAEDIALLDALIGKKPVGRLGVRPVLAGIWNALAHAVADLLQKLAKSSAKTRVFESRFVDLALGPVLKWARSPKLAPRPRPHENIGLGGL